MAAERVQKILEKEKQADAELAKAKQTVADSIEQAKMEAEVKRKEIINDANKKAEELVSKVQLDIDKMYDDAKAEAEKCKTQILSDYSGLKNIATKIISDVLF